MINTIINADDFGINETVTIETEKLIEEGMISSTTIMANGDYLEEVKFFVPLHPNVSFGVHLCLSEFASLTKSDVLRKYGITDENGYFVNKAILRIKHFNNELKDAIKAELQAQVDVVKAMNVPISHADSHHHVHTIFPLREVFAEVLKENGITKIRLGREFNSFRMHIHLCQWRRRVKLNKYYSRHFTTTSYFYPYADFIKKKPVLTNGATVELMCHPGHSEQAYSSEIQLIQKNALRDVTTCQLISYNELH